MNGVRGAPGFQASSLGPGARRDGVTSGEDVEEGGRAAREETEREVLLRGGGGRSREVEVEVESAVVVAEAAPIIILRGLDRSLGAARARGTWSRGSERNLAGIAAAGARLSAAVEGTDIIVVVWLSLSMEGRGKEREEEE